jgi:large subunit ribosomal protein L10
VISVKDYFLIYFKIDIDDTVTFMGNSIFNLNKKEGEIKVPSAKVLEAKKAQVKELAEKIQAAKMVFFVDYKGITVDEDKEIRKAYRESGNECMVVKNSLIKLACKEANIEGLDSVLEGPTAVVIGTEEYTTGPKIAHDFAKTHEFYQFKAGIMDGKAVSVDQVKKLASLPSKEVLLTQLASALIGNIRNLAVVLDQVAKKNEESVSA